MKAFRDIYDAVEVGICLSTWTSEKGVVQERHHISAEEADRLFEEDPNCLGWVWSVYWHYREDVPGGLRGVECVADFGQDRKEEAELLAEAMREALKIPRGGLSEQQYRKVVSAAHAGYVNEDLEIDQDPKVSVGDDGIWVQAWVWVSGETE